MGKDEPKNAEALREMMARGDWVTTTLREEPWFDKPILYYWVSLIFFHLLGPGEAAARLGPSLFGAAGVLLTYGLARLTFDGRTALRAGVILATSLEYFWFSRTAVVDLPLTFCVTLSLVAFYRALEVPGRSAFWYRLVFAATGGAVLAKGPVGIVLPGLVVGGYLLASRRLAELKKIPWVSGLLCFLLVAGPWYLAVSMKHGRQFWEDFIINRNVNRYLSTIHHHPGPVYYYLPVLILGLFPWGALLPFAVGRMFGDRLAGFCSRGVGSSGTFFCGSSCPSSSSLSQGRSSLLISSPAFPRCRYSWPGDGARSWRRKAREYPPSDGGWWDP